MKKQTLTIAAILLSCSFLIGCGAKADFSAIATDVERKIESNPEDFVPLNSKHTFHFNIFAGDNLDYPIETYYQKVEFMDMVYKNIADNKERQLNSVPLSIPRTVDYDIEVVKDEIITKENFATILEANGLSLNKEHPNQSILDYTETDRFGKRVIERRFMKLKMQLIFSLALDPSPTYDYVIRTEVAPE